MSKNALHLERLLAVAAAPSGRLLAYGGRRDADDILSSKVHFFAVGKKSALPSVDVGGAVTALIFVADTVVVGLASGKLAVLEASETPRLLGEQDAHGGAVRALACDPLGKQVYSAGDDGAVRCYDFSNAPQLRLVAERKVSARGLLALGVDATGATLAMVGHEPVARAVATARFATDPLREMPLGERGLASLAFLEDGTLAAAGEDGKVRRAFLAGEVDEEDRSGEHGHDANVVGLVLGPPLTDEAGRPLSRKLFSLGADAVLKAFPLDSRRRPRTLEMPAEPRAMVFVAAPARSKPEKRGGQLAVVTHQRKLVLVALGPDGELTDETEVIGSELDRLAEDTRASGIPVRQAAYEALGQLPEDEARQLLERALGQEKKFELRKLVVQLLGRYRRAKPALVRALADEHPQVREAALSALVAAAPLAAVEAGLAASYEDVRDRALLEVKRLKGQSPLLVALVADRLADAAPAVRATALEVLEFLLPDGLEAAVTALGRGEPDVRGLALVRLLVNGKLEAGRQLLEAALDDPNPDVRATAFVVGVASSPALTSALRAADPTLSFELLEQKGWKPGPAASLSEADLEHLFAAMAKRSATTALRGARALAALGDSRAVGALLQLSRDPDATVRLQTVGALKLASTTLSPDWAGSGVHVTEQRLRSLLDDTAQAVRNAAFEALDALAATDPERRLRGAEIALSTAHEDIRARALTVLLQLGGKNASATISKAADRLVGDALDDESRRVRSEAHKGLFSWHAKDPEVPLTRAAASRHADIRQRAAQDLGREKGAWARTLLLTLVKDRSAAVGLAAYGVLTDSEAEQKKPEPHLAALASPRPEVRAKGAKGAQKAVWAPLRAALTDAVKDPYLEVAFPALESVDRLSPNDQLSFASAFASPFYELRVLAGELCGRRRDSRALAPMQELLSIPKHNLNRPSDALRQRAARALADVGDPAAVSFFVAILDDEDPIVREMAARGLATAAGPAHAAALVSALGHDDLPVRSWAAEGLARLGDTRAIPVLAGTQLHTHPPIRKGAIVGFVALGEAGVQGIHQGLADPDREVQDFVLAVVMARDLALAKAGLGPDLALSALSAGHLELRYFAVRWLEARLLGEDLDRLARELVGPRRPEKAADQKDWPSEAVQQAAVATVVRALASEDAPQRYAAAQVLALRAQPLAFFREAALLKPKSSEQAWVPHTNWSEEQKLGVKRGWLRRLFGGTAGASNDGPETLRVLTVLRHLGASQPTPLPPRANAAETVAAWKLVFGSYAGLVRQTPAPGEADEGHRVRRDAAERLVGLVSQPAIGRDAVLPVLRQALADPHHLVRRAALGHLEALYGEASVTPLALAIHSGAGDVGRLALDRLLPKTLAGDAAARSLQLQAVDAPHPDVRAHAATLLERLYPATSIEPLLLALNSRFADLRADVVDRLVDADDPRVLDALSQALGSAHPDLRERAARVLAKRGEPRAVEVLGSFLRTDKAQEAERALEALVALAHAPKTAPTTRAACARAVLARLVDDPDRTANRRALLSALARIGDLAAEEGLYPLLADADVAFSGEVARTLYRLALDPVRPLRKQDGVESPRYQESVALRISKQLVLRDEVVLRLQAATCLGSLESADAEPLLLQLLSDREESVRVAACKAVAFRAAYLGGSLGALVAALKSGRRELVLPAAEGLAQKGDKGAFMHLALVFVAGASPEERSAAARAMGVLGDRRALEYLLPLVTPAEPLPDDLQALVPAAVESLGRLSARLPDPDERRTVREQVDRLAREGALELRQAALEGLGQAADPPARALIEATAVDSLEHQLIRLKATEVLGKLAQEASLPAFEQLLADDNYSVRAAAVTALAKAFPGDPTRMSLLALQSPYEDVSGPAANFLANHGDPQTLVSRLGDISHAEVRKSLRRGLIRRRAVPVAAVQEALKSKSARVLGEAAWLAGATQDPSLKDAVAAAVATTTRSPRPLTSETEAAWTAAWWAAARLGAPVAASLSEALTATAPVLVRRGAARWLARHGVEAQRPLAEAALWDADREVRASAAEALAKGDATNVFALPVVDAGILRPVIRAAVNAGSAFFGSEVSRRLALPMLLGDNQLALLAAEAHKKGNSPERLAAIAALGRLGDLEARKVLEEILQGDAPADVKKAAWKALKRLLRATAIRWAPGQDQERGKRMRGLMAMGPDEDELDEDEDEDFDDEDEDEDEDVAADDDEDEDDDDDFDDDDDEEEEDDDE